MMTERTITAQVVGDRVNLFVVGQPYASGLTLDDAEALGDELSNCAMRLRYDGWTPREGKAGPVFDSFGPDPFTWNIESDDDEGSSLDEIRAACEAQGVTLAEAVAQNLPVARDVRSADVTEEVDDPRASDGSGRPGSSLVGGAISVWTGLQRGRASVATIAAVFNITPAMVREAVDGEPYLYLAEGADDATTFVEADGE